jgi:hypothetical protein
MQEGQTAGLFFEMNRRVLAKTPFGSQNNVRGNSGVVLFSIYKKTAPPAAKICYSSIVLAVFCRSHALERFFVAGAQPICLHYTTKSQARVWLDGFSLNAYTQHKISTR